MSTARTDDGPGAGLGRWKMCVPAKAGASASAAAGLAVWALVAYVPAFHNGVPQAIQDIIPFVIAWGVHTFTAWAAKHPAVAVLPDSPPQATAVTAPGASSPGPQGPVPAGEDGVPGAGHFGSPPSAAPGQPFTRYYPPGPGWRRW
jgi:hypothetical protein